MKRSLFVVLLMMVSVCSHAQVYFHADEAFQAATESNKPVLLIFAGSDWCAPCIQLEKKILNEKSFLNFASQSIVQLKADFPQRRKLPAALQVQNDTLAARYNPKGIFPMLVLLKPDKTVISTIQYQQQSPQEFISIIKSLLFPTP